MNRSLTALSSLLFLVPAASARDIYIANVETDGDGTREQPLRSLNAAVKQARKGDTVWAAPGRYHESVAGNGRSGVTVRALDPAAPPVLCGTRPVPSTAWKLADKQRNIWKRRAARKQIWQFFLRPRDGKGPWRSMVNARWPNVDRNFDEPYEGTPRDTVEGSFWSMDSTWARLAGASKWEGPFVNEEKSHKLSAIKASLVGAMLVQFRCISTGNDIIVEKVTEHEPGSASFQRTTSGGQQGRNRLNEARYHLESHPALLDHPNEWLFDAESGEVSICLEAGRSPEDYLFEGKVADYILTLSKSNGFTFDGIEFFGGGFRIATCRGFRFENCRFVYSSYNKRMLGRIAAAKGLTRHAAHAPYNCTEGGGGHSWVNCVFAYSEGCCIYLRTWGNVLRNNLFHNSQFGPTIYGTASDHKAGKTTLERNTYHTLGLQNVSKNGPNGKVAYNHTYNMMWMGDFSCHQVSVGSQPTTHVHHNWVINAFNRNGVRFDGDPAGQRCRVNHVVATGCLRGFRLKGDRHQVYHVTAFGNGPKGDINIAHDKFYGYDEKGRAIKGRRGSKPLHGNENSVVKNIAGQSIDNWPLVVAKENQAGIWHGKVRDCRLAAELRDPRNLDFRPRAGSSLVDAGVKIEGINDHAVDGKPDIGAYERGLDHYWIPGRQEKRACTPVPPDGSTTVRPDADLMWLECYGFQRERDVHKVYFATDRDAVERRAASAFRGEQKNNIFSPSAKLAPGQRYYWCIDEVVAGELIKGNTWSFVPGEVAEGR